MRRITWPGDRGSEITTYLESPIPICTRFGHYIDVVNKGVTFLAHPVRRQRQTAVTSHIRGFPPAQGTRVIPSGRLPSVRDIPLASLVTRMPADTKLLTKSAWVNAHKLRAPDWPECISVELSQAPAGVHGHVWRTLWTFWYRQPFRNLLNDHNLVSKQLF